MQVKITRIHLSEESGLLTEFFDYLHEHGIRGATIFRGVEGFGLSGKTRESHLLDMHFDLPMVLEFFDTPEKIDAVMQIFEEKLDPGKTIQWLAEVK